jgi:EpsI family protein
MKTIASIRTIDLMKATALALLLAGMYYSTFIWLVKKDWSREDYNYGWLIPLVVLYLIWEKRSEFLDEPAAPSWNGFYLLVPGVMVFWLGELSGEYFSLYFSSWLIVIGLFWSNFGWQKLKSIGFALFITLTMFPPPQFIHNRLTLKLKLISSQLGVEMIQAYGLSAYREGNIIDLGFTQLQVVDACSGLRYLFPLTVMAILLAYFVKMAFWKKLVLVISVVPLTIATNAIRIAMTGIFFEIWGAKVAEGFFHGFSGWFIFITAFTVLLLEMWVLKKNGRSEQTKTDLLEDTAVQGGNEDIEPGASDENLNDKHAAGDEAITSTTQLKGNEDSKQFQRVHTSLRRSGIRDFLKPPQFVVAAFILGVTLLFSQAIEFREKIPVSKSFDKFPLQLGNWIGNRQKLEQSVINTLDLSDYIFVNYRNEKNKWVNFYIAYYESQRKGKSIHSPASCLPGSGWIFKQAGNATVKESKSNSVFMPVNRALIEQSGSRQLCYYWFPQRGRILINAFQLKIFAFWDALTRQRTDGALVRVITPVYKDEDLEDAERRLQAFTRELVPVLGEFLPD